MPQLIYLPEKPFVVKDFLEKVKALSEKDNNVVICVSEGIKDEEGNFICESASSGVVDSFGHKSLSGTAKVLENLIRDNLGIKARGIEINLSQRCASHLASKTDIKESFEIGKQAVSYALTGHTGEMLCFKRKKGNEYKVSITCESIENTANKEKCVPLEWITDGFLTDDAISYLAPLIQGERDIIYENGLIKVIRR
jgi:6-phosphofructokinase 1